MAGFSKNRETEKHFRSWCKIYRAWTTWLPVSVKGSLWILWQKKRIIRNVEKFSFILQNVGPDSIASHLPCQELF
jgi:hypothetical protein